MPTRVISIGSIVRAHDAHALAPVDTAEPPAVIFAERKFVTEGITIRRAEPVSNHEVIRRRFLVAVQDRLERVQSALRLVIETHGRIVAFEYIAVTVFRGNEPRRSRLDMLALGSSSRRIIELVQSLLVGIDNRVHVLQVITAVQF